MRNNIISYNMLPCSPGPQTLAQLRGHSNYLAVMEALDPAVRTCSLAEAMRGSALIGNIAGVLALLDAGVPATSSDLEAALISVQPGGLAAARLLFDAGARLAHVH